MAGWNSGRTLGLAALAAAIIGAPGVAHATLRVYEGFEYDDMASLRTLAGGTGWGETATWTNTGAATETVTATGLTYPGLAVAGNKVLLTGQQTTANGNNAFISRDTADTFGADGTTIWFSVIGQRLGEKQDEPPTYTRVFSVAFLNVATENFSIGELTINPADAWGFNRTTVVADAVSSTVPIDTLAFVLLKIEYLAGDDNVSMWVNPNLAGGEAGLGAPSVATTDPDATFNRIRLQAGGSQTTGTRLAASGLWDEVRVGDTFADVAPTGTTPTSNANFDNLNNVNGNDFLIWQRGLRTELAFNEHGDANLNGAVDATDLGIWKSRYGQASVSGVPEPSAVVLTIGAAISLWRRRRRS